MSFLNMRFTLIAVGAVVLFTSGFRLQREQSIRPKLNHRSQLTNWDLDGSGSWDIADAKLQLIKAGTPSGPFRRPAALAILKTGSFEQVTVELDLRSLAPINVPRRDVDLVVGYESPTRFYYVHLSAVTDDVHNGIFLVADADRRRIDAGKGIPQMKDQAWHRAKVVRNGTRGNIEVFFDGSKSAVLSAVDTTIKAGRVGVGSFDDTAEFKKILVTGSQ